METGLTLRRRAGLDNLPEELNELTRLQVELIDRELFLTNLRSEILAFETLYVRRVGVLYLKLDEWNAKIAKKRGEELYFDSAKLQQELSELLGGQDAGPLPGAVPPPKEWFGSRRTAGWSSRFGDQPEEPAGFHPSAKLKTAYREVARRVHPDFAVDAGDRRRREALMKEANSAYQQGDLEALRAILENYDENPEQLFGTDGVSNLERVRHQIAQIHRSLERIEREIVAVLASDIGKLKERADAAWATGQDLLAEMADDLRKQIEAAQERFYSGSGIKGRK